MKFFNCTQTNIFESVLTLSKKRIISPRLCVIQKKWYICSRAEVAQLVEHWLPKPRVAGSSPVFRSKDL